MGGGWRGVGGVGGVKQIACLSTIVGINYFFLCLICKETGEVNLNIYIYICIYKCGGRVYLGIKCSMLW